MKIDRAARRVGYKFRISYYRPIQRTVRGLFCFNEFSFLRFLSFFFLDLVNIGSPPKENGLFYGNRLTDTLPETISNFIAGIKIFGESEGKLKTER